MNKDNQRKISENYLILIFIAIIIILISASLIIFRKSILNRTEVITRHNISETQELYKQLIKGNFQNQFAMLEAQARFFKGINLENDEELKASITKTRGIGDFKKIGVANFKGNCTNYTGQAIANVYNKKIFSDTFITANPKISDRVELDESLEPTLLISYPLKSDEEVKAILLGTISYSTLKKLFSVPVFDHKGYYYIVAKDGNIVLCTDKTKGIIYNVNFFSYIQNRTQNCDEEISRMKKDFSRDKENLLILNGDEKKKIFSYTSLDFNNWYLVSVIPESYIKNRTSIISAPAYTLISIIIFSIIAFITALIILFRKNTDIEKDNERLIIANNQTQSLIFEYEIPKGNIIFSGDTRFIFGTEVKNLNIDFIRKEFYKRIHPDDMTTFYTVRQSIKDALTEVSTEFRYKAFTGEYFWVRLTASTLLNSNGDIYKFIGTINNVNSQVLHEQELKSIAECDKLTMLLNKVTMENKVRAFFENEDEKSPCVLFIIDLDNFKKVNDNLGHLIGDQAIIDTGKKLSLIFSEKDYISRFGGDEFCILMLPGKELSSETRKRIIKEKAKSICSILAETYYDKSTAVNVTASVGIALFPEDGSTYEEIFEKADKALYHVKQNGKNNYKLASRK